MQKWNGLQKTGTGQEARVKHLSLFEAWDGAMDEFWLRDILGFIRRHLLGAERERDRMNVSRVDILVNTRCHTEWNMLWILECCIGRAHHLVG
jgi:hypothetical protein